MKQEEWKRLDAVRPDWFDCNYDKPPNTSSAPSYLIWPYLNCWSLFQHRAPGNCNSQTCKWGAYTTPTYSILDLLMWISSVNNAWSILHLNDDLFCSMTFPAQSSPVLTTQNLLICSSGDIPVISLHICEVSKWRAVGGNELIQIWAPSKTRAGLMLLPDFFWAEKPTASHRKLASSDTAN